MSLLEGIIDSRNHPLAVVEDIAADNNWSFERSGEDEVTIVSKGEWTDYQLSFTWMSEIEALHLACAFDMKIPVPRRAEVQRLVACDQRAIMGRAFRPLDPHRHDHAPPGAGAARRAHRLDRAMREPCSPAPSTPASAIIRHSSSWCGPAKPPPRQWARRCSTPRARRRARVYAALFCRDASAHTDVVPALSRDPYAVSLVFCTALVAMCSIT